MEESETRDQSVKRQAVGIAQGAIDVITGLASPAVTAFSSVMKPKELNQGEDELLAARLKAVGKFHTAYPKGRSITVSDLSIAYKQLGRMPATLLADALIGVGDDETVVSWTRQSDIDAGLKEILEGLLKLERQRESVGYSEPGKRSPYEDLGIAIMVSRTCGILGCDQRTLAYLLRAFQTLHPEHVMGLTG